MGQLAATDAEIASAYFDEGLSQKDCKKRYKVGSKRLARILENDGRRIRSRHDRSETRHLSRAALTKAYLDRGMSITACAEIFQTTAQTVYRKLVHYGIDVRGSAKSDLDEIVRLYVKEGLSTYEVARRTGVNRVSIASRLRRAGIELRKPPPRQMDRKTYEREYVRARRRTDPKFALNSRMSVMIRRGLVMGKQGQSWLALVPYTLDDLRAHLDSTMPEGFGWDDFLSGDLHIDHEIPLKAFNFSSPKDHDFQRCWSLSNLRLLPAFDNLSKGARLEKPFQPSLL